MPILKAGAITFTYPEAQGGEVEIQRGVVTLKVPFEALTKLVAERVRVLRISEIEQMKPAELLGLKK